MRRADSLEVTLMPGNRKQKEKGATEDEMAGWHHRLSGHESGKLQENSGGQRSRVCHSPWGHKESDVS